MMEIESIVNLIDAPTIGGVEVTKVKTKETKIEKTQGKGNCYERLEDVLYYLPLEHTTCIERCIDKHGDHV